MEEVQAEIKEFQFDYQSFLSNQLPGVVGIVIKIFFALIVLLIGIRILKMLLKLIKRNMERTNIDDGVIRFLISIGKTVGYFLLVLWVAQIMGLETTSIVALAGSAGLAIGLSLQGSLANLAGGVLLLTTKPFVIGDDIIVGEMEGVVSGIDIIYTTLNTFDNRKIVMPNGKLANSDIINVTHSDKRRLDLTISVEYSEKIKRVKDVLEKMLEGHDMVLSDKPVQVFVESFESGYIRMGFRVWVATENYWNLRCTLMEEVKETFDENEILISCEKMRVEMTKE